MVNCVQIVILDFADAISWKKITKPGIFLLILKYFNDLVQVDETTFASTDILFLFSLWK